MRAGLFVLALAIFSGGAWATEWTLIRDDAKSGEKAYIDKSKVIRRGSLAAMWLLTNYERPKGVARKNHMSEKALVEYDCQNHESRKLEFTWHSLHDGEGELIYSYKDLGVKLPIAPKSAEEAGWKIACAQK